MMSGLIYKGLAVAGVSLTGLVAYFTVKIYILRKKYAHIPGPPTRSGILGFYLGNLLDIMDAYKRGVIFPEMLLEWLNKYGPVVKFQSMNEMVITTIDQEAIRQILITKNFPKHPFVYKIFAFPFKARFLGTGLVTELNEERWRHRRGLFNPGFNRNSLMSFMSEFNLKGDILLERLRTLADGKTMISFFKEVNHAALDVIASIAFGMNIDSINDPTNDLNANINQSLIGFNKIMANPFISFNPKNWSYIKQYKLILKKLRDMGREQILNRLKLIQDNLNIPNDMLTSILKGFENEAFDIEDLIDEFVTFFVAGQETTANALAFCVLALGRNPNALGKLREELDQVLGSRLEVKYEDLPKLKYTSCVIKETLRLWPPVPGMSRVSNSEIKVNGYDIPVGTWFQLSPFLSGRSEENFKNATEFMPERFLKNSDDDNFHNYAYHPFSLGPRNCIGQNFAQMEAKVILAKFVKCFDFKLDPNQDFGIKQEASLRPTDGTRCTITLRNN